LASALRRVASLPRGAAPFRGVPLLRVEGFCRGQRPSEEESVASVSTPGVGRCPCRRAPTRGSVLVAESLTGPVADRRQSGLLTKKGTFVLLAGFRVVTARLPSGFPPKRGAFVTAGWPPWLLPGCFGVSHRGGAPSGCWLAAWSVRRRSSGCRCPPPKGWLAGPGTLFRGPPPSEEGVAAQNPLAARRRSAGWLPSRRCRPPRRSVLPGRRSPPGLVVPKNDVGLGVPGVARLPKKVGTRLVGGLSRCAPAPPSRSPSVWLRLRTSGASPFGLRWPFPGAEAPCPVRCCGAVRLGPFPSSRSWLSLARRFLLPQSRRTVAPGCGPSPTEAGQVMASPRRPPGKPGWVRASLLRPLANQRLLWRRLPRPLPPRPKLWGLLPWRRDRRPSKEFIHVKERSVKNVGR
jgi:hypothetical protein